MKFKSSSNAVFLSFWTASLVNNGELRFLHKNRNVFRRQLTIFSASFKKRRLLRGAFTKKDFKIFLCWNISVDIVVDGYEHNFGRDSSL